MTFMQTTLLIACYATATVFGALLLGYVAGLYKAAKDLSYRWSMLRGTTKDGRSQEFLLLYGDEPVVNELYQVVVATTARVQEKMKQKTEGVVLDDREPNGRPADNTK